VLWRKACQPIAEWLAQSFFRAAGLGTVTTAEDGRIHAPHTIPPKPLEQRQRLDPPTGPLRAFIAPGGGYRQMRGRGGFTDDPVPLMCWECGKALAGRKVRFLFGRVRDNVLVSYPPFEGRRTAGGKQAADTDRCGRPPPLQWRARDAPIRRDLTRRSPRRSSGASKVALLPWDRLGDSLAACCGCHLGVT
jgi:hypothetical protein